MKSLKTVHVTTYIRRRNGKTESVRKHTRRPPR